MIFSAGFFNTFLFAMLRSNDNNRQGNKSRFANIANNKVAEIKAPKATVPPKLEVIKTENPKNNTMEV